MVGVLRRAVIYGGPGPAQSLLGVRSILCLSDAAHIPVRTNVWKAIHSKAMAQNYGMKFLYTLSFILLISSQIHYRYRMIEIWRKKKEIM